MSEQQQAQIESLQSDLARAERRVAAAENQLMRAENELARLVALFDSFSKAWHGGRSSIKRRGISVLCGLRIKLNYRDQWHVLVQAIREETATQEVGAVETSHANSA
jgi:multidrug resistance efflux pump